MPTLDFTKSWDRTLRVDYSGGTIRFSLRYDSGREFPWAGIPVSQPEWNRLIAWVQLQREEETLQKAKQKKT